MWPNQAWEAAKIGIPWLSLIRNSLNTEIWSFKHPDFWLFGSHGTAHLASTTRPMWDKYQLARLAGEKFKTNTLIIEQKAGADPANYEDRGGLLSEDNSIRCTDAARLVFMCCHNAIGSKPPPSSRPMPNPTGSLSGLAAELTNHLGGWRSF